MQKMGQKTSGPLPRQSDESMVSYVRRRKLWWSRLEELGPQVQMDLEILAELFVGSERIEPERAAHGLDIDR